MSKPVSRRRALTVLAGCASAPFVVACSSADKTSGAPELPGNPEDWVAIPLDTVPALELDGASVYDNDPALLHVWLLDDGDGAYRAVWRICTHGACEVEYAVETRDLWCPCHGSRFDREGTALNGPATKPLRVLEAQRIGDTLYVRKPF